MAASFDERIELRWHEVGIIGSGPAGLSAAARAAELGIPHVLLEAEAHASNTIHKYQKGKHVMAEPQILPLRSPLSFAAGRREEVLGKWDEEIAKLAIDIRYGQEVTAITGSDGAFQVATKRGDAFLCRKVVLAIGLQGNLRKLGVRASRSRACSTSSTTPRPTRTRRSWSWARATPRSRTRWPSRRATA